MTDRILTGFCINPFTKSADVVEFHDCLDDLHRLTDCECIDIVRRTVEGKPFTFVVDDNGLFRDRVIPTYFASVDDVFFDVLVGAVLVCREKGPDLASLTPSDVRLLRKHLRWYNGTKNGLPRAESQPSEAFSFPLLSDW